MSALRIFIAAPLREYEAARRWAAVLERSDVEVVSSWHSLVDATSADPGHDEARAAIAARNFADLDRADCLLLVAIEGTPRASLVETGYALGQGKPVFWIHGDHGEGRNVADAHPLVRRVCVWAAPSYLVLEMRARCGLAISARAVEVPAPASRDSEVEFIGTPEEWKARFGYAPAPWLFAMPEVKLSIAPSPTEPDEGEEPSVYDEMSAIAAGEVRNG